MKKKPARFIIDPDKKVYRALSRARAGYSARVSSSRKPFRV